jgi:putative ABC transport system permease protein
MSVELTLAWRYLRGRPARTALTLLAIVFGALITFGMNGVVPAVRASFGESVRLSASEVDLIITPDTERTFDAALADLIRGTPGVAAATGVLERPLLLPEGYRLATSDGLPIDGLVVNGWEPAPSEAVIPYRPLAGRWLAAGERDTAMVRETLLARTGLALGDTLRLPSADGVAELRIVGVLPGRPLSGDEHISVPLEAAQRIFNTPGRINAVAGQFAPGVDEEAVRRAVHERAGPGFTLGDVRAGSEQWAAVLRIAEVVFTLFGVLALAMGGFIIFNTFRTSVAERRRDIGMLRAIGGERGAVVRLVLFEGLLLGALGTAIGMLLGALAARALLPLLNPVWVRFFGAPLGAPEFAPPIYALTIALGVGIPLLSGLLPALAASRFSPLEALRPASEEGLARIDRRHAAAGGALIVAALAAVGSGHPRAASLGALLFLLGLMLAAGALIRPLADAFGRLLEALFAREGHVARRNLGRNPGRAAVTVSAVMVSLAVIVALAGLAETFTGGLMRYLERSMRADYLLLPEALVLGQANVGAGPELARRMRETPGVAAVTTIRRGEGQVEGEPAQLIGVDPQTYPRLAGLVFSTGDPARAYAALAEGRLLIVNDFLAARRGLAVGQEVTVQTASGPRRYHVVGIGADYLNSRVATAYISHANLEADFGETSDVLLMADRAEGAAPAEVEAALGALARDYPAFSLLSYDRWRASQLEANQTRTNILYVLMGLLALPSLLALANTLGINVLERTREIGVLRAIGAERRQVRRIILAESLLLATIGATFGVLGGVLLGYAFVGTLRGAGFQFEYVFPAGGVVVAAALALAFGVIAALLPARRAAALDVIAALRYE